MYNSSNLETKDKAWQRAGVSPVPSNYVCRFAAPPGLILKNKRHAKRQTDYKKPGYTLG